MKNPIACYDNNGKTSDRYTIIMAYYPTKGGCYEALGCNSEPFHGIGMHVEAKRGRHLGKKVGFFDLPEKVRQFVIQELDAHEYRILMYLEHKKPVLTKQHCRNKAKELGLVYQGFWDGVQHFCKGKFAISCYEEQVDNGDLLINAEKGYTLMGVEETKTFLPEGAA